MEEKETQLNSTQLNSTPISFTQFVTTSCLPRQLFLSLFLDFFENDSFEHARRFRADLICYYLLIVFATTKSKMFGLNPIIR
jgi:hypothetical protein